MIYFQWLNFVQGLPCLTRVSSLRAILLREECATLRPVASHECPEPFQDLSIVYKDRGLIITILRVKVRR